MTYQKFDVSDAVAEQTYNAIEKAKENGKIVKGTNEVTKAIERNEADLIVIAGDVSPEEIVMHIPALAEEKDLDYTYVPSQEELGMAAGINVSTATVAVTNPGNAEEDVEDLQQKSRALREKDEE